MVLCHRPDRPRTRPVIPLGMNQTKPAPAYDKAHNTLKIKDYLALSVGVLEPVTMTTEPR